MIKNSKIPFVGRAEESSLMEQLLDSGKAEFITFYGRRRVGKTYYIKAYFNNNFTFYCTGLSETATTEQQLANFINAINKYFKTKYKPQKDWMRTFAKLELCCKKTKGQKVLFIDELPWLDTPKSDFLIGLEWFWNNYAHMDKDLKLIVCGSAASWIIKKLHENIDGLYNRVTAKIKMEPFTLAETEAFFEFKKIQLERYQIIQLYQVFGGVPYYLDLVTRGKSVEQIINSLCFNSKGLLKNEFMFILKSLFRNINKHLLVLDTLYINGGKLNRNQLLTKSKLGSGGTSTIILDDLEMCGFIEKQIPFNATTNKAVYIIADNFTHFHFKFIKNAGKTNWSTFQKLQSYKAWTGYAFEQICKQHIPQLLQGLGVPLIAHRVGAFIRIGDKATAGTQIDLVIERDDRVVNIFEMKFLNAPLSITPAINNNLRNKIGTFQEMYKPKGVVHMIMVSTFGVKQNAHTFGVVQKHLTMDCLFVKAISN